MYLERTIYRIIKVRIHQISRTTYSMASKTVSKFVWQALIWGLLGLSLVVRCFWPDQTAYGHMTAGACSGGPPLGSEGDFTPHSKSSPKSKSFRRAQSILTMFGRWQSICARSRTLAAGILISVKSLHGRAVSVLFVRIPHTGFSGFSFGK